MGGDPRGDGGAVLSHRRGADPHHVPLAYHLGYDLCAETLLREKEALLDRGLREKAWVCFQHDAHTALARIGMSERGQFVAEPLGAG